MFQRINIHSNWTHEHRFVDPSISYVLLTHPAVTIATDFLLALLPIPLIWQLQLNGRTKISLVCILSLGLFAAAAAIVKSEKQKTALQNPDPYVYDTFTIWRFIEFNVGIIAASLPSLKTLFKRVLNGTRCTSASGLHTQNRLRYSVRPEPQDDEMPLEDYGKIGNSFEVSSKGTLPLCRPKSGNHNSEERVRTLEPHAVFVETKWRVS
jgi:hypothetical protein